MVDTSQTMKYQQNLNHSTTTKIVKESYILGVVSDDVYEYNNYNLTAAMGQLIDSSPGMWEVGVQIHAATCRDRIVKNVVTNHSQTLCNSCECHSGC